MGNLPQSALKAAEFVDLPGFLDNVSAGFHWDILDRMESGVYIVNKDRRIMYWSDSAERITGYTAEEVLGIRCKDELLKHVDDSGKCLCRDSCPLVSTIQTGTPACAEVYLHHRDGHRVPVHVCAMPLTDMNGEVIGAIETFSEVTELQVPMERVKELEQFAYIDALTGIANRRLLEHELGRRLQDHQEQGWPFSLILIDVDHFKTFNDTYGHDLGDEVLKVVARTLSSAGRSDDLAGRWGGEEFLIITREHRPDELQRFADRVRHLIAASSVRRVKDELHVTVSAGCAIVRKGETGQSLFARADECLYQAKANGRNCIVGEWSETQAMASSS